MDLLTIGLFCLSILASVSGLVIVNNLYVEGNSASAFESPGLNNTQVGGLKNNSRDFNL